MPVPVETPAPPPAVAGLALDVAARINHERAAHGLPQLSLNARLSAAAEAYAALHFAQQDPFRLSHDLDGSAIDRAARHGYHGGVGEVLAIGAPAAAAIVDLWLASPPHAALILGADFVDIGVGCAQGPYRTPEGYVWTLALCAAELGTQ